MSLQEAQSRITSSEFVDWLRFFEWEEFEKFSSENYYLAQIAAEVRRGLVKRPRNVRIADFLLKFKREKKAYKPVEDNTQNISNSKSFWMTLVKSFKKQKPKQKDK